MPRQQFGEGATGRKEIPPPIPFWSWLSAWGPLNVLPAVLPPLALFAAPADVLDRFSSLRALTERIGSLVPRLQIHANSTSLPQVSLLVDTLMVTTTAWISAVVLIQSTINYRYLLRRHLALAPHPARAYIGAVLGAPLGIGMIAAHVMLAGDPSWAKGATMSRTAFYGFLAFATPLLAGLSIGGQLMMIRMFLDGYLFSRPVTVRGYDAET